jgi:hypothetical protein
MQQLGVWACEWGEGVTVNGGEDVRGRCERFDGFVTEVCMMGFQRPPL